MKRLRRLGAGLRAGAGRSRPVPHRVPRLLVPLVSRSRRPADRLADDPASAPHALLRAARDARVGCGLPARCSCVGAQGRRGVPAQAPSRAPRRSRAARRSASTACSASSSRRCCRRRRRSRSSCWPPAWRRSALSTSCSRSRIGRGVRYFGEGLLALWYGERAAAFLRDHAQPIAFWWLAAALVLGVGWMLWQHQAARNGAGCRSARPELTG